jgi:hypothetical protein
MSARIYRILKSGISRKLPIRAFSFEDCVSEDELDSIHRNYGVVASAE